MDSLEADRMYQLKNKHTVSPISLQTLFENQMSDKRLVDNSDITDR